MDQEELFKKEINEKHFRVTVFGSARTKKDETVYKQVYDLAYKIGEKNIDIITGGGPGIMEAASEGHQAGNPDDSADSIGLVIKLPFENEGNPHLDIKTEFNKFSNRLDTFMALSNIVVVMPGGIGTCLELFYTWQLIQVKHINPVPIIVVGNMWEELIKWCEEYLKGQKLISPEDMDDVKVAKNNEEAMSIILEEYEKYKKGMTEGNEEYLEEE